METEDLEHAPDDEEYWLGIQQRFKPMYVRTQLANTRRGPAPEAVREKVRSLVDLSLSYELDEYEPFTEMKESGSTLHTRSLLASYFGAQADEIALTRNAMEGINTVIRGIDLNRGDEIVATNYCYDFNLAIIRQRAARDGIKLRMVELPFGPVGADEMVEAFTRTIGSRTRLVSVPHVDARTGLVFPVEKIATIARRHNALTLVDGAHSVGQFDFSLSKLGVDAFSACLHKHMHGPRGTGFLFVKKEVISQIWPLFASWSDKPPDSIEKFEEVGTVFKALPAAVPEAMMFNSNIGQGAKNARYEYLRNRWASRLRNHSMIRMLTDVDAEPATSFGAFRIDGVRCKDFARMLLQEFDIDVKAFTMEEDASMEGIHLSPGLANTVQEIDDFVEASLILLARLDGINA